MGNFQFKLSIFPLITKAALGPIEILHCKLQYKSCLGIMIGSFYSVGSDCFDNSSDTTSTNTKKWTKIFLATFKIWTKIEWILSPTLHRRTTPDSNNIQHDNNVVISSGTRYFKTERILLRRLLIQAAAVSRSVDNANVVLSTQLT